MCGLLVAGTTNANAAETPGGSGLSADQLSGTSLRLLLGAQQGGPVDLSFDVPPCAPDAEDCFTIEPASADVAEEAFRSGAATIQMRNETAAGSSVEALQAVPTTCTDYPDGKWTVLARSQACAVTPWTLTTTSTKNGVKTVTGTMNFLTRYYVYGGKQLATWAHQLEVQPLVITGATVGTTVTGLSACNISAGASGACGADSAIFNPKILSVGTIAGGEAYQTFTGTAMSFGTGSWTLKFVPPTVPTGSSAVVRALPIRCDAIVGKAGCVFPDYVPLLKYSAATHPEFVRHVNDAQASGLPGKTVPLHRMTNATLNTKNRTTSCPQASWLPRPTGLDCDEYPFASTYEGAFLGGGTARTHSWCKVTLQSAPSTGSAGYSICMINLNQNRSAGALSLTFFNAERVRDGDAFYVRTGA